ncbi:hypothetical protein SEA_NANOSMITE_159 [Mycobacterium phage Nanosmite]|nr:hypothetical protein SEA_NANOSMITE_159 [Mycobacterium phage Nanosmite]
MAKLDQVPVNLIIEIDLRAYADDYGMVGTREARGDLKRVALQAVQHQLKLQGHDKATVSLKRYGKATE